MPEPRTATTTVPARGDRTVPFLDMAEAAWTRNEFGVDVLTLSRDALSGAVTFALRTPPGLVYPEEAHFYDCEQDLFQLEGEFHHDELVSFREGDYVYRPVGTVYGHGEGSTEGGIIVAALARQPVRFHFQGHPEPWTGHYRVDRLWSERPVEPRVIGSARLPWTPLAGGLAVKRLRGEPGVACPHSGASAHSPWAADAAFMLRLPSGWAGPAPNWPRTELEVLATAGRADIGGRAWRRGCYAFGGFAGECRVREDLVLWCRAFTTPA